MGGVQTVSLISAYMPLVGNEVGVLTIAFLQFCKMSTNNNKPTTDKAFKFLVNIFMVQFSVSITEWATKNEPNSLFQFKYTILIIRI